MESNRKKMTAHLLQAEELLTGRILFSEPRPLSRRPVFLHPFARCILPITNDKQISYGAGGKLCDAVLHPGDAVFCRPGAWLDEHFEVPHQMISVVFYEQFIRYLYIDQHDGAPRNGPDVFFHTRRPPTAELLDAVSLLTRLNTDSRAAGAAFRTLLILCVQFLTEEEDRLMTDDDRNWNRLEEWMQLHFFHDLVREDIAGALGIHAAKLSRLLRARCGKSVRGYLNDYRLEYAEKLLASELSVEEISQRCGFAYPGYFIRLFRARHDCTPGEFREQSHRSG